jgi:exopolyphosphatase/guanosine-5'-triphosphate,3'-diphosphate pyrophosphatase
MATFRLRPMRCACIDIGSNTTRLLVADCAGGRLDRLHEERAFTRVGRALDADGAIPAAMVAAVAEVVAAQRATAHEHGAEQLRVVATAAIRGAANGEALVAAIRARAGVEVVVLSGEDEARLAFHGATRTLGTPLDGPVGVVDVGGGSTEIAVGTLAGGVHWARSFPVGSSSLAARCDADPPRADDLARMRAHARASFALEDVPPAAHALAVGGSAASLPAIAGRHLDPVAIERALAILCAAPAAEVARRHGLAVERAQLLHAGILVLEAAGERLGRTLRVGCGGLREGVVLELAGIVHNP